MACSTNFNEAPTFACVMEIVSDLRSGTPSRNTLEKVLWLAGCAVSTISKSDDTDDTVDVMDLTSLPNDVEGLSQILEDECTKVRPAAWTPNPGNWKMILEILLKLLPLILK